MLKFKKFQTYIWENYVAFSAIMALISIIALLVAFYCTNDFFWKGFFVSIGGTLLTSSIIYLLFESSKRLSIDNTFKNAIDTYKNQIESGLKSINLLGYDVKSFRKLFFEDRADEISILISSGRTWSSNIQAVFNENSSELKRKKITIIIPDVLDSSLSKVLSFRYDKCVNSTNILEKIRDTLTVFKKYEFAELNLYAIKNIPSHAFFISEKEAIITLYNHQKTGVKVPTMVIDNKGALYKFISDDLKCITRNPEDKKDVSQYLKDIETHINGHDNNNG